MDLKPADALLGYKLSSDPIRTPPYQLSNEEELREAIGKGVDKEKRARTREVFIEIHNMVCGIGIRLFFVLTMFLSDHHALFRSRSLGKNTLHQAPKIALSWQIPLLHSLTSSVNSSAILNANDIMANIVMLALSPEPTSRAAPMHLHSGQRKS
jgi:hypothetical protein